MRLYQIILRSGANMNVMAKAILDDPARDVICFFHDATQNDLMATVRRDQIAGIIFHLPKSGVVPATTPLPGQR